MIRATVDLRVYRIAAVKKAAYRVASACTVVLGTPDGDHLPITFMFGPSVKEDAAVEAVRGFFQEVLDQELREEVAQEMGPIRALILAQAFSKTDLIRDE